MSNKDEPWSDRTIHSILEVVVNPLVLPGAWSEVMLRAHQHKVHTAIVKTIPVENTHFFVTYMYMYITLLRSACIHVEIDDH